jgi:hypothetical protein
VALDDLAERVTLAVTHHWGTRTDIRIMAPPSSHEERRAIREGIRHFWSGEYEEALAAFDRALELEPGLTFLGSEKQRRSNEWVGARRPSGTSPTSRSALAT